MISSAYTITKEESKIFNFVKVVMCVAVLFLHSYSMRWGQSDDSIAITFTWITNYFSNIICDCAVPIFITMSSVFLYSRDFSWLNNIKRKVYTLLIPYFIFNALWIAVNIIGGLVKSSESPFLAYNLVDWIDAFLGIRGDFKPALSVLWYVRDLFLLNIFAAPLKKLIDMFPRICFVSTVLIWLSGFKTGFVHSYAIVFFIFGYYVVRRDIHVNDLRGSNFSIMSLAVISLSVVDAAFPQIIAIHRFFILIECVYVFMLANRINYNIKLIGVVVPATFFIYLSHRFLYLIIDYVFDLSLASYMISYFLKPVLAFVLCPTIYYVMTVCLPRTLALMTGGRSSKQ